MGFQFPAGFQIILRLAGKFYLKYFFRFVFWKLSSIMWTWTLILTGSGSRQLAWPLIVLILDWNLYKKCFDVISKPMMYYCAMLFKSDLPCYFIINCTWNWFLICKLLFSLEHVSQATREEITNSFRRLSRLYHPDKHTDPQNKKEAEVMFNKTKKAYESKWSLIFVLKSQSL